MTHLESKENSVFPQTLNRSSKNISSNLNIIISDLTIFNTFHISKKKEKRKNLLNIKIYLESEPLNHVIFQLLHNIIISILKSRGEIRREP